MGENSISILCSINGYVQRIAEQMSADNGKPSGKEGIAKLNSTGIQGTIGNAAKKKDDQGTKSEKAQVTEKILKDASFADIVKLIGDLPDNVKKVAKLNGVQLAMFKRSVNSIIDVLDGVEKKFKGADANMMKSISTMMNSIGKVGGVIQTLGKSIIHIPFALLASRAIPRIVNNIVEGISSAKGMNDKDVAKKLAPLIAISNLGQALENLSNSSKYMKDAKKAGKSLGKIFECLMDSSKILSKTKMGQFKKLESIVDTMTKMEAMMKSTAKMKLWILPAIVSMKLSKLFFASFSIMTIGIMKMVHPLPAMLKVRMMKILIRQMAIVAITAAGTLAIYALTGVLAVKQMGNIVKGFAVFMLVLGGIALTFKLASLICAEMILMSPSILKTLVGFSAYTIGMIMALAVVGNLVEMAFPQIATGFASIMAVMMGMTFITRFASRAALKISLDGAKALPVMMSFVAYSVGMILAMAVVGVLVKKAWDLIVYGFIAISGAIWYMIRVGKVMDRASASLGTTEISMKRIFHFVGGCIGLILLSAGVGYVAKKYKAEMAVGVTLVAGTVYGVLKLARYISTITRGKTIENASMGLMKVVGFIAMAGLIPFEMIIVGNCFNRYMKAWGFKMGVAGIVASFGMLSAVIVGAVKLAKIAEKLTKKKTMDGGLKGIMLALGIIAAAGLVVLELVAVSAAVRKLGTKPGAVAATFLMVGAVIFGAYGVAKLGERLTKGQTMKKGLVGMFMAEGVIGGALVLVFAIAEVSRVVAKVTSEKGGIKGILVTFGMLSAILIGTWGVAKLASTLGKSAKKGAVAMLLMEGVLAGGLALVYGLYMVAEASKGNYLGMLACLGFMAAMIAAAGGLALAASLFVLGPQAVAFFAGVGAMLSIELVLGGAIGLVMMMAKVAESVEAFGGSEKFLNFVKNDFKSIIGAFTPENIMPPMKLSDVLAAGVRMRALMPLVNGMIRFSCAVSKLAQLSQLIPEKNKIRAILGTDKDGNIKYGDPVDVVDIVESIGSIVQTFVNNTTFTFKDAYGIMMGAKIYECLGKMIDPIDKFVEMLSKYDASEDGKLRSVRIDSNGKVKYGPYIDVVKVSTSIASAVSTFLGTLYSEDNISKWFGMSSGDGIIKTWIKGKKNEEKANALKEAGNVLGVFVQPVSDFISLICGLAPEGEGGKIRKLIKYDAKGNPVYGPVVDLEAMGTKISKIIGGFLSNLYNGDVGKIAEEYSDKYGDVVWDTLFYPMKKCLLFTDEILKRTDMTDTALDGKDVFSKINSFLRNIYTEDLFNAYDKYGSMDFDRMIASANSIVAFADDIMKIESLKDSDMVTCISENAVYAYGALAKEIVKHGTISNDAHDMSRSVDMILNSLVKVQNNISDKKTLKSYDTFNRKVITAKNSFKAFDDVLKKDERKRIQRIKDLGKALKSLADIIKKDSDAFKMIKGTVESVNKMDVSKIKQIAEYETATAEAAKQRAQANAIEKGGGDSVTFVSSDVIRDGMLEVMQKLDGNITFLPFGSKYMDSSALGVMMDVCLSDGDMKASEVNARRNGYANNANLESYKYKNN